MNILHTLADMGDGRYIISLGEVRLKVGPSDKAAAKILTERMDKYADGQHTNGEVLALLLVEWMEAIDLVIKTGPDDVQVDSQAIFEDPTVMALWDAQWWLRFLIVLDEEREPQDTFRQEEVTP